MRTLRSLILAMAAVALGLLQACEKEDAEQKKPLEGKDSYIVELSLTVNGVSYPGAIAGKEIVVEVPENVSLKEASAAVVLSEGATIEPDPATIKDWSVALKFTVTSKSQEKREYSYACRYARIVESGSVCLATQAEVNLFAETGISRIKGDLVIGTADGEVITDLKGLDSLRQVSRTLIVNPSYKGENLEGLENLDTVGSLRLGSMTEAFRGSTIKKVTLPSLRCVLGDFVVNSSGVETLALPQVENVDGEFFVASNALTDFEVKALRNVGGGVFVASNALTDFGVNELKNVGGGLTVSGTTLTSIGVPSLEGVGGVLSVIDGMALLELSFPKLISIGGLKIAPRVPTSELQLEKLDLPKLAACNGEAYIKAENMTTFSVPSLESQNGNMSLTVRKLEALDFHATDFNGYTLEIWLADELKKIVGPTKFDGSILCKMAYFKSFYIEGISTLTGSILIANKSDTPGIVKLSFSSVGGYVHFESNDKFEAILLTNLESIGGDLSCSKLYGGSKKFEMPNLKKIGGSCLVMADGGDVQMGALESIGEKSDKAEAVFDFREASILCQNLRVVEGSLQLIVFDESGVKKLDFSKLERVNKKLMIKSFWDTQVLKEIDFSKLDYVQSVKIIEQTSLEDFSCFANIFEHGRKVITEEGNWAVSGCGYNPTLQDMQEGRYKKE